ncbi:hypothetical protein [Exiguobacterium sp. s36]|uniref:hypothetical protein n=1 Tax=Exiguobacterium sp. s36 TaxID=2751227 RepID=UPI001BEC624A|nr:hypothetical protein [Exiguobacterium sp. s36]
MLNRELKNESIERLSFAELLYGRTKKGLIAMSERLYNERRLLNISINEKWEILNHLKHKPADLKLSVQIIAEEVGEYEKLVEEVNNEARILINKKISSNSKTDITHNEIVSMATTFASIIPGLKKDNKAITQVTFNWLIADFILPVKLLARGMMYFSSLLFPLNFVYENYSNKSKAMRIQNQALAYRNEQKLLMRSIGEVRELIDLTMESRKGINSLMNEIGPLIKLNDYSIENIKKDRDLLSLLGTLVNLLHTSSIILNKKVGDIDESIF